MGRNNVRRITSSTPPGPDLGKRTKHHQRCERLFWTGPQVLFQTVENVLRCERPNWRTAKDNPESQWSLKEIQMIIYIGIDWSAQKHDLVFMNEKGGIIERSTIAHTWEGLAQIGHMCKRMGVSARECLIGIETSHNLVLDYLLSRGYTKICELHQIW